MDCAYAQELISAFVDGELPEADKGVLFEHLAGCPDCRGFFESAIRIRSLAMRESLRAAPASLDEKIENELQSHRLRPRLAPPVRIAIPMRAAIAMAMLLILISVVVSPMVVRTPEPDLTGDITASLSVIPPHSRAGLLYLIR